MAQPTWHLIEGDAGCAYAVEHDCVAVVVDALRASATAAMLLDAGATELLVVREIDDALAARATFPDALLFGERGGLPPDEFDYGNSPGDASAAQGHRVVFTTTTGAGRLVACWGAAAALMGTTVNAHAVVRAARTSGRDVVVIPAGLMHDPSFDAQEDWVAAAAIASLAHAPIGEGAAEFDLWRERIADEGLDHLFETAP
ncbi:MAG: 2-phosphosulfolactate phosphatase, partial [bacterium]|nr:2-phosphosulfolactate phosphatase [bacterium]